MTQKNAKFKFNPMCSNLTQKKAAKFKCYPMWPNLTKNTAKFLFNPVWPNLTQTTPRNSYLTNPVWKFWPQKRHKIQILTSVAKFDPKTPRNSNLTQCNLIICYETYGQVNSMLGRPGTASKKKSRRRNIDRKDAESHGPKKLWP